MEELNRDNGNSSSFQSAARKSRKFLGYQSMQTGSKETIINEEVKITDFAYTKFQELRQLDGISDD